MMRCIVILLLLAQPVFALQRPTVADRAESAIAAGCCCGGCGCVQELPEPAQQTPMPAPARDASATAKAWLPAQPISFHILYPQLPMDDVQIGTNSLTYRRSVQVLLCKWTT